MKKPVAAREQTIQTPSATSATPSTNAAMADLVQQKIQTRAYELYLARGCEHGHALADWLQAQAEINNELGIEGLKIA